MSKLLILMSCFVLTSALHANEDVIDNENTKIESPLPKCSLDLPSGWKNEDKKLPEGILMVYVGEAKKEIIPTINIAWETCSLNSASYLKQSKKAHLEIEHTTCKEVGTLNSKAGKLHLLQVDRTTNWGKFRFLQGLIVKNGIAYVVTGTSSQEDFATLTGSFFNTLKSFNID